MLLETFLALDSIEKYDQNEHEHETNTIFQTNNKKKTGLTPETKLCSAISTSVTNVKMQPNDSDNDSNDVLMNLYTENMHFSCRILLLLIKYQAKYIVVSDFTVLLVLV